MTKAELLDKYIEEKDANFYIQLTDSEKQLYRLMLVDSLEFELYLLKQAKEECKRALTPSNYKQKHPYIAQLFYLLKFKIKEVFTWPKRK